MTAKKAKSVTPTETSTVPSKKDAVITLLGRPQGASLAEIVDATGWLPHTARAMLTGLRKKFEVMKEKVEGVACYSIGELPK